MATPVWFQKTVLYMGLLLVGSCFDLSSLQSGSTGFKDFPKNPISGGNLSPETASALEVAFTSTLQSLQGGPCISEPTFGALYPRNFTPPLIEWIPAPGQDVFELRLHVQNQANDLVVYTDDKSYTLPDDVWAGLSTNSVDSEITISVRGGQLAPGGTWLVDGAFAGSQGNVRIAPVDADGAIVYWTTSSGTALKGFRVGDKKVRTVLSPSMLTGTGTTTNCIGCHASSPDGLLVFFGRANPPYTVDARLANGGGGTASQDRVTTNALSHLARESQDLPVMSKGHFSPTDQVVVTVLRNAETGFNWELVWTDLLATSGGTGILARTGDPNGAAVPNWSHDGTTIAYTSSATIVDAHPDLGEGDIFTVLFNNRAGGRAAPLPGVNDPSLNQYYPAYSPSDTFLAFNRNPRGHQMYDAFEGEVWVAPSSGGTPTRIAANDPPACSGQASPGLTNSWPRWSPQAVTRNGKHYYWLVFSSKRRPSGSPPVFHPQLFLSAIVTKDTPVGEVLDRTYPAVYISTQPANESNHTPVWDDFMIAPAG